MRSLGRARRHFERFANELHGRFRQVGRGAANDLAGDRGGQLDGAPLPVVQPILLGVGDAGDRLLQGRQQGLHPLTDFFIENFFGGPHRRLATFLFRSPADRLGLLLRLGQDLRRLQTDLLQISARLLPHVLQIEGDVPYAGRSTSGFDYRRHESILNVSLNRAPYHHATFKSVSRLRGILSSPPVFSFVAKSASDCWASSISASRVGPKCASARFNVRACCGGMSRVSRSTNSAVAPASAEHAHFGIGRFEHGH